MVQARDGPRAEFMRLHRRMLAIVRRGMKRAKVALARTLATVLHRLGIDESEFRFGG